MTEETKYKVRLEDLEGWLLKLKDPEKSNAKLLALFSGSATKRWFRVMTLSNVSSMYVNDLALCYFRRKSERDGDVKGFLLFVLFIIRMRYLDSFQIGWIYLHDIIKISEEKERFTIFTSCRNMVIQAQSKSEHRLWLQGISERCLKADLSAIKSSMYILVF
jgi:hypothetical protein